MNENNTVVVARPAQEQDEIEIDLLDLLAALLLKWKTILAVLLIGAVVGCGAALLQGGGEKKAVTDEQIAEARALVASDKAEMVDQLFFQYVSYKELQEDIRNYYGKFAGAKLDEDNVVMNRARYFVSSGIDSLGSVLPDFALKEEDYQALREIAPDEVWGSRIYDRIIIDSISNSRIMVSNLNEEGTQPVEYLFTVTLYGNSEEQCQEMMAIIDAALNREVEALKAIDPEIRITFAGSDYDRNVVNYVQNLRKSNIDKMTVSERELNDLSTKVGKLSSEEKAYYNLLQKQYDEVFSVEKKVSWKKWTVIGACLGAVVACCGVFLPYLMDGKIKSAGELEQNGKLLNRVFIKGKKNLFGSWAAKLIHADDVDPALKADMVATDLGILAEKNEKKNLMLLYNQEDADAAGFAEQVRARLHEKDADLKVNVGNPLRSVEELEMAAQADMGVVFAEVKKSRRAMLREWRQVCARYKLPLAGSVAVQRCW